MRRRQAGRRAELDLEIAKSPRAVECARAAAHAQLPLEAGRRCQTLAGGETLEVGPIKGDNFEALLPTLPGILRPQDGHISIKGASPTQSSVQINAANVTDPSTGTSASICRTTPSNRWTC